MTVVCRQGESLSECHDELKRRFNGIKISKDELGDKKSPLNEGKGEGM